MLWPAHRHPRTFAVVVGDPKLEPRFRREGEGGRGGGSIAFPVELAARDPKTATVRREAFYLAVRAVVVVVDVVGFVCWLLNVPASC